MGFFFSAVSTTTLYGQNTKYKIPFWYCNIPLVPSLYDYKTTVNQMQVSYGHRRAVGVRVRRRLPYVCNRIPS
jgi:hypothetical protein